MVQKFPTTAAYTSGPDKANVISVQKNFEDLFVRTTELEQKVIVLEAKAAALQAKITAVETDLEAKTAALQAKITSVASNTSSSVGTLSTAASIGSGGGVYVMGSDTDPFVTGPSIGPGKVLITEADGTVREAAQSEFYWEPNVVDAGYHPVFYKDLVEVSVTRVSGNSENQGELPPNRPGFISTNYDNGHSVLERIPLADWNPPLDAWNNLPREDRRELTREYTEGRGFAFMLGGDSGDVDSPNTFESDAFRSFLESRGITGNTIYE